MLLRGQGEVVACVSEKDEKALLALDARGAGGGTQGEGKQVGGGWWGSRWMRTENLEILFQSLSLLSWTTLTLASCVFDPPLTLLHTFRRLFCASLLTAACPSSE